MVVYLTTAVAVAIGNATVLLESVVVVVYLTIAVAVAAADTAAGFALHHRRIITCYYLRFEYCGGNQRDAIVYEH